MAVLYDRHAPQMLGVAQRQIENRALNVREIL